VVAFKQLAIPNAFSPNGDNINDRWVIDFLNDYPYCKIDIFNRNGQLVYRSVGYNGPWDGTVNGNRLPGGTYYYIIELNNNGYTKLSGSVTILR
jgi:gliding motility-associated-like protein